MKRKGLRWWVIAMIALAAVINYIDRQAFSVLWEAEIGTQMYPNPTFSDQELIDLYSKDKFDEQASLGLMEKWKGEQGWEEGDPVPTISTQELIGKYGDAAFKVQGNKGLTNVYGSEERSRIYGNIGTVFILFYAFGQMLFGRIFDKLGTRIGFVLSLGVWSLATALHAFAKGVFSFSIMRALLGLSEAGNWPGAAKGNAEWFPTDERAIAQGIFNFGASFGAMISIPVIGILALNFSWQTIFIMIGAAGLIWLIPWMWIVKGPPKTHPWITQQERDYILSGQENESKDGEEEESQSYGEILSKKESWGVIIASAAIDPIWWLFVIWIPNYLVNVYQMDVKGIAIYGWVPFFGAMLGAWFGGLIAKYFFNKGMSVDKVRKRTIAIGCAIMLPGLLAMISPGSPVMAVLIMAVILFGFQTAIGNIQTIPSDLLSGKSVGTLSGLSGMAAKLAAAGLTYLVPIVVISFDYSAVFVIGAVLVLIVIASIWLLCPKIEPLK